MDLEEFYAQEARDDEERRGEINGTRAVAVVLFLIIALVVIYAAFA